MGRERGRTFFSLGQRSMNRENGRAEALGTVRVKTILGRNRKRQQKYKLGRKLKKPCLCAVTELNHFTMRGVGKKKASLKRRVKILT